MIGGSRDVGDDVRVKLVPRTSIPDRSLDETRFQRSFSHQSLRKTLKAFAPESAPANTLRWEEELDKEDGSDVRIALFDSGVNWSDRAFAGACIRGRDFTGSGGLFDPTGHGTANAALLVGRSTDGSEGMIPGCELLVAKVLRYRESERTALAVTAGLRWVVQSGVDIIIMPFGTSRCASNIVRGIRAAVTRGCRVFAAAGNRGPDQICFPAWLQEVTAVSALTRDGSMYPGCCTRSDVDLFTWGDGIPTVGLAQTSQLSGSSSATVLAAGFAALKKAAQRRRATERECE